MDGYTRRQNQYGRISIDYDLVAATAGPVTLQTPRNVDFTFYIQRITFMPTTYSAKTLAVQDDAAAPHVAMFASIPGTAPTAGGPQPYSADFGPEGMPVSQGRLTKLVLSGAGVAGHLHIEGYQKLTVNTSAFSLFV